MNNYHYFPILKTKPSEIKAYKFLDDNIKSQILPIIEMTGARSYTYPKNCKNADLIGTKRPGDINTKRKIILDMVGNNKFILDITDDPSLRYDGIAQLQDATNGYESWINFLISDPNFRKQVIPTIQFNTEDIKNTFVQIKNLAKEFAYMALKIPGFIFASENINNSNLFDVKNIVGNDLIQSIIDVITDKIGNRERLIVILDFGYIKNFDEYQNCIETCISEITNLESLKALLISSSSFPSYVRPIVSNEMNAQELTVFNYCKKRLKNNKKILFSDFASIHPVQYQTNGGGWIPRIDYIKQNGLDLTYCYKRAESSEIYKNDSEEYKNLASLVIKSENYSPIQELSSWGDCEITAKASGQEEGRAPSHWIAVRANLYMTRIFFIMKAKEFADSFLSL